MWPRVTRYDHHKHETTRDPSVFPKPSTSCVIYNLLCNYQFTRVAEQEGFKNSGVQEYMSTKNIGHCI